MRRAAQLKSRAGRRPAAGGDNARAAIGRGPSGLYSLLLVVAYAGAVGWAVAAARMPATALSAVALASAVAYIAYALDKDAAQRGRWRIAESTLHLFELVGGWPGALLAQHLMRHKTRKASCRFGFWCMVTLHCALLAALCFREHLPL